MPRVEITSNYPGTNLKNCLSTFENFNSTAILRLYDQDWKLLQRQ
jgi:hypothetical protein